MKEVTFIRRNIEKWRAAESVVATMSHHSPDCLADTYTELTADLAFAQTHYPESRITLYLNNLSAKLHQQIYRNKREKWNRVLHYWQHEVPMAMYETRRLLLVSLLIFITCVGIGIISVLGDIDFARLILGNYYIDMTLNNIENGTPMAVYNDDNPYTMFLFITFNNIRVAFMCFMGGLFTSIFTGFILAGNGIMLGVFQTFFFQHNVGWESMLTIWQHGTLEIWMIVVAGSAGLAMGNGWLFPGTYTRLESFKRGAKLGMKIIFGTVPVFIMAAFIESYQTRHTDQPIVLRLLVITLSLGFILFYYIYLPYKLGHESKTKNTSVRETYI